MLTLYRSDENTINYKPTNASVLLNTYLIKIFKYCLIELAIPPWLATGSIIDCVFEVSVARRFFVFCAVIPRGLAAGIGAGRAEQIYL